MRIHHGHHSPVANETRTAETADPSRLRPREFPEGYLKKGSAPLRAAVLAVILLPSKVSDPFFRSVACPDGTGSRAGSISLICRFAAAASIVAHREFGKSAVLVIIVTRQPHECRSFYTDEFSGGLVRGQFVRSLRCRSACKRDSDET